MIIGGGAGGLVTQLVKYPSVELIHLVEIDGRVLELCKKYLKSLGIGYEDPRVTVFVEDGIKYLTRNKDQYDVIITDCSDPVG